MLETKFEHFGSHDVWAKLPQQENGVRIPIWKRGENFRGYICAEAVSKAEAKEIVSALVLKEALNRANLTIEGISHIFEG